MDVYCCNPFEIPHRAKRGTKNYKKLRKVTNDLIVGAREINIRLVATAKVCAGCRIELFAKIKKHKKARQQRDP